MDIVGRRRHPFGDHHGRREGRERGGEIGEFRLTLFGQDVFNLGVDQIRIGPRHVERADHHDLHGGRVRC